MYILLWQPWLSRDGLLGSQNGFQRRRAFTAPSPSLWYRNRLMKCATASTIITWWIHSLCMSPQVVNSWNEFWGMCYLYCMCVCACISLGILMSALLIPFKFAELVWRHRIYIPPPCFIIPYTISAIKSRKIIISITALQPDFNKVWWRQ